MSPSELQAFAREALCDNRLAAMAVEAGEKLSLENVVQLSAEIEAIYMLASLEGRGVDLIEQHRLLWRKAAQFFEDVIAIWQSVPTDGAPLKAHRQLLAQLCELARDRVEFYSLTAERRDYIERNAD